MQERLLQRHATTPIEGMVSAFKGNCKFSSLVVSIESSWRALQLFSTLVALCVEWISSDV